MKLGQILVATDFSEAGNCAVAEAAGWAQRYRSALHIVHVVPPERWFAGVFRTSDPVHEVACCHGGELRALHVYEVRIGPSYDSVCDYAARFGRTNLLIVPPAGARD